MRGNEIEKAAERLAAARRRRERAQERERLEEAQLERIKERGERPSCASPPLGLSPDCPNRTKFEIEFPLEDLKLSHDGDGWVPVCGQHFQAMVLRRLQQLPDTEGANRALIRKWE